MLNKNKNFIEDSLKVNYTEEGEEKSRFWKKCDLSIYL